MALKNRLPRLVTPSPTDISYPFDRNRMIDGTIPVYWGPKQPPAEFSPYLPPEDWPPVGSLLVVPRVVRFIWQYAELDAEAWSAGGFSGDYTVGLKPTFFNLDDVFTGEGSIPDSTEIPVHIHTTGQTPIGPHAYQTQITYSMNGTLHIPDFGTFRATGDYNFWLGLEFLSDPYSLVSYALPATHGFSATFAILSGGFIPAHPFGNTDGFPPITITPSGPNAVGITQPIRTGRYEVDSIIYGTSTYGNDQAISVPEGYVLPEPRDPTIMPNSWKNFSDDLEKTYAGSTNPWVNAFQKTTGLIDWISLVSPTERFYMPGDTLHVLLFSKVDMPMPGLDDPLVQRIRDAYPYMVGYTVVIYIDTGYISDCQIPGDVKTNFVQSVTEFCIAMENYGFVYGGSADYKDTPKMKQNIQDLITAYLPNSQ